MVVCSGMKRDKTPCTLPAMQGSEWCWNHDPARAEERRRNASRAATLKHSKVGQEIREVRQLARDLLEIILEDGVLGSRVRRHLQGIVQLLQTYARLAELELAAGEKPEAGDVSLPEGTAQRISEWAEGEEAKEREREKLLSELVPAMEARGYDTEAVKAVLGG